MNFSSKQISMFSKPMQSNNSQHFLAPAALFFCSIHHRPTKQLTQKNPWTQYWHSLEEGSALDDHIISITADRRKNRDQIYLIIGPKANKSFREEKNIQSCNRLNWLARVAKYPIRGKEVFNLRLAVARRWLFLVFPAIFLASLIVD